MCNGISLPRFTPSLCANFNFNAEGEDQLFEKKMSKEEKKAAAKAAREAKKKAKVGVAGLLAG